MENYTYFKSDMYTEEVHDFWAYILYKLPNISIIEDTDKYIYFRADESVYKHLKFLCDCDFGMVFEGTPEENFD